MLGRLWAALGLTGVYSGCVMIGEPPLLVSGLASNYFRIRALLSTPDFGLRVRQDSTADTSPMRGQECAEAQIQSGRTGMELTSPMEVTESPIVTWVRLLAP